MVLVGCFQLRIFCDSHTSNSSTLAVSGQMKKIQETEITYLDRNCCCNSHHPMLMKEKALGSTETFCRPNLPVEWYLDCTFFLYYLP